MRPQSPKVLDALHVRSVAVRQGDCRLRLKRFGYAGQVSTDQEVAGSQDFLTRLVGFVVRNRTRIQHCFDLGQKSSKLVFSERLTLGYNGNKSLSAFDSGFPDTPAVWCVWRVKFPLDEVFAGIYFLVDSSFRFRYRSAPLKFVPLSEKIVDGTPLRATKALQSV